MHLISKLTTNWIWATFEPQNSFTNPERCQALGCNDSFGSVPATSNGANASLSTALSTLMTQANLASEWQNYRLDGVQTDFLNSDGSPNLLGNSVIEGENAGVPLAQSSCISCHAISSVKSDGTDGFTLLIAEKGFPTGTPAPLPSSDWIARDFVWSMGEACPGAELQTCGGKGAPSSRIADNAPVFAFEIGAWGTASGGSSRACSSRQKSLEFGDFRIRVDNLWTVGRRNSRRFASKMRLAHHRSHR